MFIANKALFLGTQGRMFAAVSQHLVDVAFAVGDGDVGDVALVIAHEFVLWVDKSLIWSDAECGVACQDFVVQGGVYFDAYSSTRLRPAS